MPGCSDLWHPLAMKLLPVGICRERAPENGNRPELSEHRRCPLAAHLFRPMRFSDRAISAYHLPSSWTGGVEATLLLSCAISLGEDPQFPLAIEPFLHRPFELRGMSSWLGFGWES